MDIKDHMSWSTNIYQIIISSNLTILVLRQLIDISYVY